ncbi:hypothetical protein GCM10010992_14010 [Cloacibacterium rupense]|uniref:Copper-binding protein MbnP-like domain-containing protein n=1 Tax=Cloacibacterium rupense TaxID=517423 RepID=A0ABQ2NIT2_9FLAO|nr:MbnP family protein [Cloacibacterium rupense]GGP03888.1 hypothetical protein GCM10010992_14010 [Cloacibacterium rupense]
MKKFRNIILALTVSSLALVSCNRDDEAEFSANDKNNLTLKFENTIDNVGTITVGQTVLTSSSGQKHTFTSLKYIVSNVVLIKTDGTEVKYNYDDPDKGAFIVDQATTATSSNFVLSDIPAGDYKQVRFGLGISPKAFTLGQAGQASFWDKAKASSMSWSWASGYKFANFEGNFGDTSGSAPIVANKFQFHSGNIGDPTVSATPNVYKEITLTLPSNAKVRKNIAPQIHIMASINKFLSGKNKIVLDDTNKIGMHPTKPLVAQGVENMTEMFYIDHVHND